jgi:hypothetical protein
LEGACPLQRGDYQSVASSRFICLWAGRGLLVTKTCETCSRPFRDASFQVPGRCFGRHGVMASWRIGDDGVVDFPVDTELGSCYQPRGVSYISRIPDIAFMLPKPVPSFWSFCCLVQLHVYHLSRLATSLRLFPLRQPCLGLRLCVNLYHTLHPVSFRTS